MKNMVNVSLCILIILVLSLVQGSTAYDPMKVWNTSDGKFRDDNPALGIDNSKPDPGLVANLQKKLYGAKMEQLGYSSAQIETSMKAFLSPPTGQWGTLPSKGNIKTLVFLVRFPDINNYTSQGVADVTSKMNGPGDPDSWPADSVHDFYNRSSYGQLDLKSDVYGWYTAAKPRNLYITREELMKEVLDYYDGNISYDQYDANNDGFVDGFYIYWTGPDTGWSGLWWAVSGVFSDFTYKKDGKNFGRYTWEWYTNPWGNTLFDSVTPCHETGHMLGLPDYYDYDNAIGPKGGLGGFDMMDSNWADHNAFSKYLLDWISPAVIGSDPIVVSKELSPSGLSPDAIIIMPGATLDSYAEFFMVQNRYPAAGNDPLQPPKWIHPGLAVWHVDATIDPVAKNFQYNNSVTNHKLLRLMEADGLEHIENGAGDNWDEKDLYRPGDMFGPNTTPNSFSYASSDSKITIQNIVQQADASIVADYRIGDYELPIAWQKVLGGIDMEAGWKVQQTSDGGYILIGWTESDSSGDVGVGHGAIINSDVWVVKLNSAGVIQWQKLLGGNSTDVGYYIQQTSDGGYILTGSTYSSNSGDVGTNHYMEGYSSDIWVVKLDSAGTIQWQKVLGGSNDDVGWCIQQTKDGGYILTGNTYSSNSGDVSVGHGGRDVWVVKLSNAGTLQWQNVLGGSGDDRSYSIRQTNDSGYILTGDTSSSNNGNVGANHGGRDVWVVKLSSTGTIQWQNVLGGSGDEFGRSIQQTRDGGYILLAGTTSSSSGNVGVNHGKSDAWVVKLRSTGTLQWQKVLGGSEDELVFIIRQTSDDGYIFTGNTYSSNSGDVGTNHGMNDAWVVKLDSAATIEWQKVLGGINRDYTDSIELTSDGGYILLGDTYSSNSGDVGLNHGNGDFWVVKLKGTGSTVITALPGFTNPPTDPDGDGIFEDLNGNGRLDFADVVLYFNQMEWIAANEPISAFDLNGNGRIDFADIVKLFGEI